MDHRTCEATLRPVRDSVASEIEQLGAKQREDMWSEIGAGYGATGAVLGAVCVSIYLYNKFKRRR